MRLLQLTIVSLVSKTVKSIKEFSACTRRSMKIDLLYHSTYSNDNFLKPEELIHKAIKQKWTGWQNGERQSPSGGA